MEWNPIHTAVMSLKKEKKIQFYKTIMLWQQQQTQNYNFLHYLFEFEMKSWPIDQFKF